MLLISSGNNSYILLNKKEILCYLSIHKDSIFVYNCRVKKINCIIRFLFDKITDVNLVRIYYFDMINEDFLSEFNRESRFVWTCKRM